ncbi:hypothetical protein AKO1_013462 [Acrasis kona]|uniref:BRO1 domain-containing protein n=1 Tax=Acrasis kona TaxID=1008807 RepID=A0AAW2ZI20_9EUKA
MKCPTPLLVPHGLIAKSVDLKAQVKSNNKNNSNASYNTDVLEELQRFREFFTQSTKEPSDEEDVLKRMNEYLSVMWGFVFAFEQKGIKQEEKIQVAEQQGDSMVLIKPTPSQKPDPPSPSKFSKLRNSMSFEWCSSQKNNKTNAKVNDSLYEVVMVLLSVINILSQQAQYSVMNDNGKKAFKTLLRAYGMCVQATELSKELDSSAMNALPFELNAFERSKVMLQIIKSQVQEMGFYAAMEKEDKQELVAKISRGAYESYLQCQSLISNADATVAPYSSFVDFKCSVWEVFCKVYSAVYCNKNEENGVAVSLVRSAKSSVPSVIQKSKSLYKYKVTEDSLINVQRDSLVSACDRFDAKFTKENSIVFHQQVPDNIKELPVDPITMGTPTPFTFPKPHAMWTPEVYSSFNISEYLSNTVQQQDIVMKEQPVVSHNDPVVQDKKRERSPEIEEEAPQQKKKSARYDSGGISLCVIC